VGRLTLDLPGVPDATAPRERWGEIGRRAAVLLVGLLASAAVWATWRVFVGTYEGQLVDQAAFEGADLERNRLWRLAEPVLDVISVPFIAAVLVVAVVIALVRRRWLLATQVALLIAGANLTGQILKKSVLARPDLEVGDRLANSLPSGHTIAATSCAVALVLVVPRRWRAATAVAGALYAAGTGVSTLVGKWHRPADVVAGLLVVLGALAGLALERTLQAVRAVPDQHHSTGLESRTDLLTAYGGGALGVVAVTCLVLGVVLVVQRITEPRDPARDRGPERAGDPQGLRPA